MASEIRPWQEATYRRGLAPHPVLVERDAEVALLRSIVTEPAHWKFTRVVVEGNGGNGRTTLLRLAASLAQDTGHQVVWAGGGTPDLPSSVRRELATAPATAAPTLLVIDDLHRASRRTLAYVACLLRKRTTAPLLLLTSLSRGVPATAPALVHELTDAGQSTHVILRELSIAGVGQAIRTALGDTDSETAAAAYEVTRGNPALLAHLLRRVAADHPGELGTAELIRRHAGPTIRTTIQRRHDRLHPDALALVRALAVVDEYAFAARLVELTPPRAASATEELRGLGLLDEDQPHRFTHPLVGDVVLANTAPHVVVGLHERAATLMIADGMDASEAEQDRVCRHLLHVPPRQDALVVARLTEGADNALRRGDIDLAHRLLSRALDEPPTRPETLAGVLARLGQVASERDPLGGLSYLERAVATASGARAVARVLPAVTHSAHRGELGALLRQADGLAPTLWLAAGRGHRGWSAAVNTRLDTADGDDPWLLALIAARGASSARRDADSVRHLVQTAMDSGRGAAANREAVAYTAAYVYALLDEPDQAERCSDLAVELSRQRGAQRATAVLLAQGAYLAYRRGDLPAALRAARAAIAEHARHPRRRTSPMAAATLALPLVCTGDLTGAREVLFGEFEAHERDLADWAWLCYARAAWHDASGDHRGALVELFGCRDILAAFDCPNSAVPWRWQAVRLLSRTGDTRIARHLAAEERELGERWGQPTARGRGLHASALVDPEHAVPLLQEAVALFDTASARLHTVYALHDLGLVYRDRAQPMHARTTLAAALAQAELCGAEALVATLTTDLRGCGAKPRRRRTGPASLTESERRVCDLAAAGHSNIQISRLLYVTQRTVEMHLTNAYRKLGIRERGELVGVLAGAA